MFIVPYIGRTSFCTLRAGLRRAVFRSRKDPIPFHNSPFNTIRMSQRHPVQNDCLMFITTNTKNRTAFFADPAFGREAVEAIYRTQSVHTFFLFGFVVMPDHCHFLLKVIEPETISMVMKSYKSSVSFSIGIGKIWQPRFYIKGVSNAWQVLRYIHMNPVKAGLCEKPEDYPWSSSCGRWDITPLDQTPT